MNAAPLFTMFCHDVERQMRFYQSLVGWRDIPEYASSIYRVLERNGTQIGFNGWEAYELLGLSGRRRSSDSAFGASSMLSFVVDSHEVVDSFAARVTDLGGALVQGPFATYYGHWQLVFTDPEGNVARATCPCLPPGRSAPEWLPAEPAGATPVP